MNDFKTPAISVSVIRTPPPLKVQYDTREDVDNPNIRKPYNAMHSFFTKKLGPGHYDPMCSVTKPQQQASGWSSQLSP